LVIRLVRNLTDMTYKNIVLSFSFLLVSLFSFSQIALQVSSGSTSSFMCDSVTLSVSPGGVDTSALEDVNFMILGSSILNEQYTLQVIWGDNTITNHTGSAINNSQAIVWSPALSHTYAVDSVYAISLTITMLSTGQTAVENYNSVNTQNCSQYMLEIVNNLDCNNDGAIDGYIYTTTTSWGGYGYGIAGSSFYLYNSIDTIYGSGVWSGWSGYPGYISFPSSMSSGNYTLGIDQSALDLLDLSWVSSLPNGSISIPGSFVVPNLITNLFTCNPDSVCLNGYVYCDDNSNGIMDGNESVIPGVPISAYGYIHGFGSITESDTTDSTGFYNIPYVVYDSAYFQLNLDQTWLAANGYVALNTYFDLYFPAFNDSLLDCGVNFNIPLICNATSSDSICVNGQVFCDLNNNGVMEANETSIPYAPILITDLNGTFSSFTVADSLGFYNYHSYHPNTDSVEVTIHSYWLSQNGYVFAPTTVSTLDCSINTNIAIDCSIPQPCDNTWINMFGAGPYYQNWTNTMALTFGNSNYAFPGSLYTISIVVPSGSELDTASFSVNNYTISGDTVSWTQTISGFDSLLIDFNIAAGIPDSTLHTYQVFISGPNLDCDSTNNSMSYTAVVGASYDPNNKLVNLPVHINPAVQEELIYTINFQNTGTAPAQDVFIEDQLSTYLDWTTFEVLSKSHNMFYTLDANGKIVFTFPQIWLPDSTTNEPLSKGYVSYKIKEAISVPINQPIENTAFIYFDLNPAIVTNTTENINVTLGIVSNNIGNLKIYPNPSKGMINIDSDLDIKEVSVFDISGKRVFTSEPNYGLNQIDLSGCETGTYILTIRTDSGVSNSKIIIE
jgi:uncharacterized repeat protein (TIGR01451 family)